MSTEEDEYSGLRIEVREGRINRRGNSKDTVAAVPFRSMTFTQPCVLCHPQHLVRTRSQLC